MTTVVNPDDINKTSFCIPFKKPPSSNKSIEPHAAYFPSTPYPSRDLPFPAGHNLRVEAYRVAWGRCLGRIQEIISHLQKSTVDEVVNSVMDSDSNRTAASPGLPFPELPVIAVINPTLGPSLLRRIIRELEAESTSINAMDTDTASPSDSGSKSCPPRIVLHFRAVDFSTVTAGMKAVVAGFVDKAKEEGLLERGERKATAISLAGYDIRHLEAWYASSKGKGRSMPSKLVVILHDFELFDPYIMQDVFYICSQTFPSLPLTFILSLSSPLPNFLNTVYPVSTLSLMRVRTIRAPAGGRVLSEVLRKTFFDVDFDPDIVIGPTALEFLRDFFTRHRSSIDVILTALQLAHLKHFSSDPLTALVHSTPSTQLLTQPEAADFVKSLRTRLGASLKPVRNGGAQPMATIIEAINKAREDFRSRARDIRLGFGILRTLQVQLRRLGYKGLEWASEGEGDVGVDVMLGLLRGRVERDVRRLSTIVKKLKVAELESMLDSVNAYLFDLPAHARTTSEEQEARTRLILLRAKVSQAEESHVKVAEEFGEWLGEYLSDKLRLFEELELWDVWYTRNAPPPAELLNPSVRASLVAGLLRPFEYVEESRTSTVVGESVSGLGKGRGIWELPDTSILFKRYLDSGRMINVFDWFESFKGVLEMQRRRGLVEGGAEEGEDEVENEVSGSPRKKGGKGREKKWKGKGKEKEVTTTMVEGEEGGEVWKVEVQARFIRALHELDYLGFVKHTGRKRDHVLRALFEVGDDDEEADGGYS